MVQLTYRSKQGGVPTLIGGFPLPSRPLNGDTWLEFTASNRVKAKTISGLALLPATCWHTVNNSHTTMRHILNAFLRAPAQASVVL